MKKKKINIEDMTMEELNKEIATCKRQTKALKITTFLAIGLITTSILSFMGLLITSTNKNNQANEAVAKLVEKPKQEWIFEESNKLIDEIKNDTNITPEKLADYSDRLNNILSISNNDYVNKHGSDEIKTECTTIKAEYKSDKFFTAGMSCAGVAFAMAFPSSIPYALWQDKKQKIKKCQSQKEKVSKYNETLNKNFNKVVTSEDIEQEYK